MLGIKTLVFLIMITAIAAGLADPLKPGSVLAEMKKVADWQLVQTNRHKTDDWTYGALYAGMMALAQVSDSSKYLEAMVEMGRKHEWKPAPRTYHADDHCVSQTYIELYYMQRDPAMIQPTRERFDYILGTRRTNELKFRTKGCQERWSWCDALFMAPPAWLRLSLATGDQKYIEFMDSEWWFTSDYLYDKEEHLYFRDSTYFDRREANGKKVFWSRGNGWVMAGLARVLQVMPPDFKSRKKYEQQYREMSAKIASLQQPDGLWRSSLLDPESYPLKETSGSGFYTFALAWGLNRGILDRATYEPVVRRAWIALTECVASDGKLEHVQPVGADPKKFDPAHSDVYGVGAFLLAGSEIYRLALHDAPAAAYCAFVPQRKDDMAWENDRIAFRAYGPALQRGGEISSGLDIWCKRTSKPIIEKWLYLADYHNDHGEGLDMYKVVPGRGAGATAIWAGDKAVAANNFATWRMLRNGPDVVEFELGYAPYEAAGIKVHEVRRITLKTGSNFNEIAVTFDWEGGPGELPVVIGVVKRKNSEPPVSGKDGKWLSYLEPEQPPNGRISVAVILPPGGKVIDTADQVFLQTPVKRGATLRYLAGAWWSRSGQFASQNAWLDLVKSTAQSYE